MGKRLFVEGMFTLVRGTFVIAWAMLFIYILELNPIVTFFISIFLATFTNYFFAKTIHAFRWKKILKEYK